jgi:hypothetical protein
VKNGSPPAPGGGHSTQFGTPLEVGAEAVPDEPPAFVVGDLVGPAASSAPDPATTPVEDTPAVELAAPAAAADCAEAAGFATVAPVAAELPAAPKFTTPRWVTVPGGVMVCATAGSANAIQSSAT